jgi:hypothetical protein
MVFANLGVCKFRQQKTIKVYTVLKYCRRGISKWLTGYAENGQVICNNWIVITILITNNSFIELTHLETIKEKRNSISIVNPIHWL